MRGEQHTTGGCGVPPMGSPPLARGTGLSASHVAAGVGITPACAGNSLLEGDNDTADWDHPRLRGEQAVNVCCAVVEAGSPPLARGTVLIHICNFRQLRITPACAGNSGVQCNQIADAGDHPRLRGEQTVFSALCRRKMGSPPLARGTVDDGCAIVAQCGITPACAGNSYVCIIDAITGRDHPRLRGEQSSVDMPRMRREGSPPLARGTVRISSPSCMVYGITPACAGNRSSESYVRVRNRDHPRLRGEQYAGVENAGKWMGSPPLARGTEGVSAHASRRRRITPACAGNSAACTACISLGRDHPRLRGEQLRYEWKWGQDVGSPPLARGTDRI